MLLFRHINTGVNAPILWISKWKEGHHRAWWPLKVALSWWALIQACEEEGWVPALRCEQLCAVETRSPPPYKLMAFWKHPRCFLFRTHTPLSGQWHAWRDTAIGSVFSLLPQPRRPWRQPLTHVCLCSLSVCSIFRWWWVPFIYCYYFNSKLSFTPIILFSIDLFSLTWQTVLIASSLFFFSAFVIEMCNFLMKCSHKKPNFVVTVSH